MLIRKCMFIVSAIFLISPPVCANVLTPNGCCCTTGSLIFRVSVSPYRELSIDAVSCSQLNLVTPALHVERR